MHRTIRRAAILAACGLLLEARGATFTWSGGVPVTPNYAWSIPGNWAGNAPPASAKDTGIVFGALGGALWTLSSQNLTDPFLLNFLQFDEQAPDMTLLGGRLQFVLDNTVTPNRQAYLAVEGDGHQHVIQNALVLGTDLAVGGRAFNSLLFSGIISGSGKLVIGGLRVLDGSAALTVRLAGANTYSGGTTLGGFYVSSYTFAGHDQAFGTGPIEIVPLSALGAFDSARTLANPVRVYADSTDTSTLRILAGTDVTFTGPITWEGSTAYLRVENGNTTLARAPSAPGVLHKFGSGDLLLTFADPAGFAPDLHIHTGRVRLGRNTSLLFSDVVVHVDDGLDLNGQPNPTLGTLSGAGRVQLGNSALALGGLINTVYSGNFSHSGGGSVTKAGPAQQTLAGPASTVARFAATQGEVLLTGGLTTTSTTADACRVGQFSSVGRLTISGSGLLDSSLSARSLVAGDEGTLVALAGVSSRWKAGPLTLGGPVGADRGALNIVSGTVEATQLRLADSAGGIGRILAVSGALLTTSGAVLGVQGRGEVTIGDLSSGGPLSRWQGSSLQLGGDNAPSASATASLQVDPSGEVAFSGRLTLWSDACTVMVNGGTLAVGSLANAPGSQPTFVLADGASGAAALTVGADQTDATYSGSFSRLPGTNSASLRKVGNGTWTLAGSIDATALIVTGGRVRLQQAQTSVNSITVQAGATLELQSPLTLGNASGSIVVEAGGTVLVPAGSVLVGRVTNYGLIANAPSGLPGSVRFTGPLENRGVLRLTRGTVLASEGAFLNYGRLDVLTGAFAPVGAFINLGVVLDASSLSAASAQRSGTGFTLTFPAYAGHVYQLQRSTNLATDAFAALGAAQMTSATQDQQLTFSDGNASGNAGFYRLLVDP